MDTAKSRGSEGGPGAEDGLRAEGEPQGEGESQAEDAFQTEGGSQAGGEPGQSEDDRTLGGYFSVHSRPPAFEGCDGQPYTVSIETERSPDLKAPVAGYLVFPRWAETGLGIVGHAETPVLLRGPSRETVAERLGAMALGDVQRLLNEAIVRRTAAVGVGGGEGAS